ncbi:MAG: HAD family hydrolase [Candidatus Helarchaeota archaeon]
MIKGLIFDLDGTLLDLHFDLKLVEKRLQKLLSTNQPFDGLLTKIQLLTKENEDLAKKAWEIIDDVETSLIPNITLYPETIPVLTRLYEKYPIVLVTFQGRSPTDVILKKFALLHFFQHSITRDEELRREKTPILNPMFFREKQLIAAIQFLNFSREEILFVGDKMNDLEAALKVGCKNLIIRRRYNPIPGHVVIKDLEAIFEFIDRF